MSIAHLKKFDFGKGNKHPGWKGGRFHSSNGYIWIYKPDHPHATTAGRGHYILEHRLVMEKLLGRYLLPNEVVHHINSIRDDNRLENLVLTTNSNNIAISNSTRPVTDSYRKKRSDLAKQFKRNKMGRFSKGEQ